MLNILKLKIKRIIRSIYIYLNDVHSNHDFIISRIIRIEPSDSVSSFRKDIKDLINIIDFYIDGFRSMEEDDIPLNIGLNITNVCYGLKYSDKYNNNLEEINNMLTYIDSVLTSDKKIPSISNYKLPVNVRRYMMSLSNCKIFLELVKKILLDIVDSKECIILFFRIKPIIILAINNILIFRDICDR